MFKISFLLFLSFSLCLAVRPKLRSDAIFRPVQVIELLKTQLSFLDNVAEGYVGNFVLNAAESDALNDLAQSLAECTTDPIEYLNSYTKSNEHVLSFGFKLRGATSIETIMMKDSTEVVDRMSGFLDFRVNNVKLSILAREIRESIKMGRCFTPTNYSPQNCSWTKQSGTFTVTGDAFSFSTKLRTLRDLIDIMTMYDSYLEGQVKMMDKEGQIPLGYKPFKLRLDSKNLVLTVESNRNEPRPLKVNPTIDHDELVEMIDYHHRLLVDDSILEAFELPRRMDRYGFGVAVDSNGDLNVVYVFGGKVKTQEQPKKTLDDYYNMMNLYVTPKGNRLNFTLDANKPYYEQQVRNNRLMADAVNLDRLNNNLRPISEYDPELFRLATNEAERMAKEGQLSVPSWTGVNRKVILVATKYVGKTTVKDFVVDSPQDVGSTVCYDNFTNQKATVYQLLEKYGQLCNKGALDAWKKFEATGNGIAFNANGDIYQVSAFSDAY